MNIWKIYIPKPVLLLLFLSVVLNIFRFSTIHSYYYVYLLWNIFLALLPFFVSSILLWYSDRKLLSKTAFYIGFIIWLLLIPNAPYIVTDLIHLGRGRTVILLYDTFLLFTSAWVGLILGMYSISHIERIFRTKHPHRKTSLFIGLIILITSFGVYLGRFLRFNSWDIVSNPSLLFKNLLGIFSAPHNYIDAYLFTSLTFIFIYIFYNAWKMPK